MHTFPYPLFIIENGRQLQKLLSFLLCVLYAAERSLSAFNQSSSGAYQLANFGLLPTISQHRLTSVRRVSFISVEALQFVR